MNWQSILAAASPIALQILSVVVTVALVPAIPAGVVYLVGLARANSAGTRWALIEQLAESTVRAAEQYLSTSDGKAKKAYCLTVIQSWLAAHGLAVDARDIDTAIESAVYSQVNAPAVAATVPPTTGA